MFKRSSTAVTEAHPEDEITLKLGDNVLVMKESGWAFKSSDLDEATFEIEKLVEEKETLTSSLGSCLQQIESLQGEVVEVNSMKSVILEMVSLADPTVHPCLHLCPSLNLRISVPSYRS
jgi:hypothetical protein